MQCPKCSYERRPEDPEPDYQCPRCGVNYAKFTLLMNRQAQPSPSPGRAARAAPPGKARPGYWREVAAFRVMAAPAYCRVHFWLGLAGIEAAAVLLLLDKSWLAGLGLMFYGPLAWRIGVELVILPFAIHETLAEMRALLERRPGGGGGDA
jgi:hypothetical protein